jgi:hypothetical protein
VTKIRIFPIIYTLLVVAILLSVVWNQQTLQSFAPPNTTYTYVAGHAADYYAYAYMIRRGREGHLMYHTAYSDEKTPDALNHPFYHGIGFLSRPFPIGPFGVFFIARIFSMVFFFLGVYLVIQRAVARDSTRTLAGVLSLTATAIYSTDAGGVHTRINWIDYFDIFNKYQRIPPHHYMAFACFAGILFILTSRHISRRAVYVSLGLAVAIGLLQPYILFFMVLLLGLVGCVVTKEKKLLCLLMSISLVMLVWTSYVQRVVLQAPFAATEIFFGLARAVPPLDYLLSLGPLVLAAFWVVLSGVFRKNLMIRYLLAWAVVPFGLYCLPTIGNLTSEYRLFQTYQHIPLGILSALFIEYITSRLPRRVIGIIMGVVGLMSLVYGGWYYVAIAKANITQSYVSYFNLYMPNYLTQVFLYLKDKTPPDSIVLATPVVSSMVPAFSDNKVIIGHESTTRNFNQKKQDASVFFSGSLSLADMETYLLTNHIAYIIFGIDAPTFIQTGYAVSSHLQEVYRDGSISVVAVIE